MKLFLYDNEGKNALHWLILFVPLPFPSQKLFQKKKLNHKFIKNYNFERYFKLWEHLFLFGKEVKQKNDK